MNVALREWINEIWAYCQEHWTVVIAAGAVLFVLLISALLVFSAKREDAEAEENMNAVSKPEVVPEFVPTEPKAEEDETEGKTEDALPSTAAVQTHGMMEDLLRSVKSVGESTGQKVESIELKIEKAQLTIHYAGFEAAGGSENQAALEMENAASEKGAASPSSKVSEQENADADIPKKFGTDNMNRARSGRVYTEEELFIQIRD